MRACDRRRFTQGLLRWYRRHRRDLPWRHDPTPYRVWISEVMLQQTTVGTVAARFEEWVARFPDVASVARASERQVLAAWQGMGYYRRALHVHRAARLMVERHGGRVPRERAELRALPGVGPYVASAVLSFAFGRDEVAMDANLTRVFMRLLALTGGPQDAAARKRATECARLALPAGRSADYNQALMDFGSIVCRPADPRCGSCFAADFCAAFRRNLQHDIPRRRSRDLKKRDAVVAVFLKGRRAYIQRRPQSGMFAGMWEFPGGKVEKEETLREALVREIREELGVECKPGKPLRPFVHHYTQFEITLHAFLCAPPVALPRDRAHRWAPIAALGDYPMPSANRKLIAMLPSADC